MGWSHILIEAHCFFDKRNDTLPKCCKYGFGNVSVNCLKYDENKKAYCPFLGFSKARSTKVLSDQEGKIIDFDAFETFDMTEKEYIDLEKRWLEENKFTDK